MSICVGCGKLINNNYYYCPWCGFSKVAQESQEALNLRYEQYRQNCYNRKLSQIEKMEEQLDNLERELEVLVLSAEMHK